MSTALVFGTFAPAHKGHIDLIQTAARENEKVIVVVSGYKNDRGDKIGLDLQRRFRYMRETFHDDSLIEVFKLDETGLPTMPYGWDAWLAKLHEVTSTLPSDDLVFYASEKEYGDELEKRNYKVKISKRKFGISATQIREKPAAYWNKIAKPFRRHFSKNVLIVGSASNGKTTLARHLGRYYSAPVSLEYSRHYQTKYNVKDDELKEKDFINIAHGQYKQTQNYIDGNENRGLVISDTNITVTKAYYDYYCDGKPNDSFNSLYHLLLDEEKWDAIIFVMPTGDYVNDNFRDMSMSDESIRNTFSNRMKELIKVQHKNTPIYYIGGDYLDNYNKAIEIIDKIYED